MYRFLIYFLLGWMVSLPVLAKSGFREITVNRAGLSALNVALWYPPGSAGKLEKIGENAAFTGSVVQRNARPEEGKHPLLIFSHGYGGSWKNLAWLAEALAERGFIVAAPNHPGTTTSDLTPDNARQLWQRPKALTQIIDALINDPLLAGNVDAKRIAAVGHSLGGWTVLELAGAKFSSRQFTADCLRHADFSSCKLLEQLGINLPGTDKLLAKSWQDNRIKAVVALDGGLLRGLTTASLARIKVPVLLLGAETDLGGLPAEMESGYVAARLPEKWRRYEKVPYTTHFSFMQLCKPGAEAMIEAAEPGEGVVCRDGGRVSRMEIHQRLLKEISGFLLHSLALHGNGSQRGKGRLAVETHG
ncbi:alpha/beta hydrolase family protein [Erwinia phyllosphaerae]|uniref:alpha/beta hydrolase family protein n=1 Tax=Erwinia phyllosphaerae TaxID=2853256 RepID=UPI001FED9131|nr:alpha/beta fold hydrolase [Erwinia phyllosphaerae]MBV4368371.1 alpha/beta fold hydrolase [Erwinia phyllosphaerae]